MESIANFEKELAKLQDIANHYPAMRLCFYSGLSVPVISKIRKGHRNINLKTILQFCEGVEKMEAATKEAA